MDVCVLNGSPRVYTASPRLGVQAEAPAVLGVVCPGNVSLVNNARLFVNAFSSGDQNTHSDGDTPDEGELELL